jgi:beta-xylosidase
MNRIYLISSLAISHALANPVMVGADPHAEVIDGKVWIFPTHYTNSLSFRAFESADLKQWREHGPILNFQEIDWIRDDGRRRHGPWAPCLAEKDGKYFFYYSVGPQTPQHPSRIGVAVADSPSGPFKDSGQPLLTGGNGFEAIDPFVFHDQASGVRYFYAGGSDGSKLRVFELADDMLSFRREVGVETPPKFTEGACIHHHAELYHFTYSHGGWRDASYSVHYATSTTPVGPWKYRGPILESNDHHKGPGHHSIIRFPGEEDWLIVYHRWNNREGSGPYSGSREIAIERFRHDANGLMQRIEMSDDGVTVPTRKVAEPAIPAAPESPSLPD